MKPALSPLEQMARAYWMAFRDGYIKVGGNPKDYPTWEQSRDPVKQETIRCLRHAVETLKAATGDRDRHAAADSLSARIASLFPDPPTERSLPPIPNDDAFVRQQKLGNIEAALQERDLP